MKPEIGYPKIVMGSYIEDLIGDIEYNMRFVKIEDPYFEYLSVEKFTLEYLLQQIVFLAICYAHRTERMTKGKKRRMD